jgi:hypothetical protein
MNEKNEKNEINVYDFKNFKNEQKNLKLNTKLNTKLNNKKHDFSIIDFPEDGQKHGKYIAAYPYQAANKVFSFLCEKYKFYDNLDGQKYLKFSIINNDTDKLYTFIGTIIKLEKPITYKTKSGKTIQNNYRYIISKYDKNMDFIFE